MGTLLTRTPRGVLWLLTAACLLLSGPVQAQRRVRKAPIHFPQDNIPERAPLPGSENSGEPDTATSGDKGKAAESEDEGPGWWDTVKGTARESVGVVKDWHARLSEKMPPPAAWAVLGLPAYLLLLLIVLVRRRRRRPPRLGVRRGPRAANPAPAPARSRSRRKTAAAEPTAPAKPEQRKEEEIPPLEHTQAEQLLLTEDGTRICWHEAFAVMGPDEAALRTLRTAMGAAVDEVTWSAAVNSTNVELLRPAWERWINALAAERVKAWLQADPLVAKTGLQVTMPDLHEVSELGSVTLTRADGLGTDLSEPQESLLQQARWALQQVWQQPQPHALMMIARRTKVASLLGTSEVDPYSLALLLHGAAALGHAAPARGNPVALGDEFRHALADHRRLVDTPVGGEGCAVHAIDTAGGALVEGVGTIAACVGGAAFSAMAVTVKISKLVGGLSSAQQESCERLGALVHSALQNRKSGDGAAIVANIRRMLGHQAAELALKRADELATAAKRMGKRPLWPDASDTESPEAVLVGLHRKLVQHALKQTRAAEARLDEIIDKLAYEGKAGDNRALAMRRLGYAVVCFGMTLLRSTGTDLLSAGREAVSSLTQE